jgi:hypothetical protein
MIEICFSSYEFLNRFTPAERSAIRSASKSDDTIADFMQLLTTAHEVINTNQTAIAGMDYLVSASILTQARRDEILAV